MELLSFFENLANHTDQYPLEPSLKNQPQWVKTAFAENNATQVKYTLGGAQFPDKNEVFQL